MRSGSAKPQRRAGRPSYCEISSRSYTWHLFPGGRRAFRYRPRSWRRNESGWGSGGTTSGPQFSGRILTI